MHMSGFVFGVGDCVVFLIQQWRLDSPLAMGVGLLASAWLGLVYEVLTWARRNKLQTSPWLRQRPWLWTLMLTLSYMLQARSLASVRRLRRILREAATGGIMTRGPARGRCSWVTCSC